MGEAFIVDKPKSAALRALNYTPAVERLRFAQDVVPLGTLVSDVGGSFGVVFTRVDCDAAHGVPLYSQVDTFAAEPEGRTIRRDAMPRPDAQAVRKWQILIAAAGQMGEGNLFGRSILADERLVRGYCGPDSLALTFPDPGKEMNLWVYAFLNTRIGLRAVRSTAYGTSIPRLRPDLIGDLPVPLADDQSRARVAKHVRRCIENRELYLQQLRAATAFLETAEPRLGNSEGLYGCCVWSVTLRASSNTIAARNHRPAAHVFPDGTPLSAFLKGGRPRKANRFARTPCSPKYGAPFLGQRDLFLVRPIPQHIRPPSSIEELRAEPSSIIVAAAGQSGESTLFGRCELGDHFAGSLVSEHTLHLLVNRDEIDHRYLFAVLHCPWGVGALKSCATGSSVPSLDPTLLGSLRIPRLGFKLEAAVAKHIENAYLARSDAERAEATAIETIETEVLPKWLG